MSLGKRKINGDEAKAEEDVKAEVFVGSKKYERSIKLDYLKNEKEEQLKHVSYTGTSKFPLQRFLEWFGVAPASDPKSAVD